jgi:hypothetical protein
VVACSEEKYQLPSVVVDKVEATVNDVHFQLLVLNSVFLNCIIGHLILIFIEFTKVG